MKHPKQLNLLIRKFELLARDLGFDRLAICDSSVRFDKKKYDDWIEKNFHGSMKYLEKNIEMRLEPRQIRPSTNSIICVTANYLTKPLSKMISKIQDSKKGYISAYATGRDYHKIIRKQLVKLSKKLEEEIKPFGYRVFTDSAPIYEKPLARYAGLGWIGKNTLLINKEVGSFFFLGEIFTDLKLPTRTKKLIDLCGSCTNCIDVCPTNAIVAPYKLDSRKCISYLTIESKGSIPIELREKIGNRIFGCDDCQIFCPWNKYSQIKDKNIFSPTNDLDNQTLKELFLISEVNFKVITAGTALKRINYDQWIRNLAVAIGNSQPDINLLNALKAKLTYPNKLVREHIKWAIKKQYGKLNLKKIG